MSKQVVIPKTGYSNYPRYLKPEQRKAAARILVDGSCRIVPCSDAALRIAIEFVRKQKHEAANV